jgi:hypothetical protein
MSWGWKSENELSSREKALFEKLFGKAETLNDIEIIVREAHETWEPPEPGSRRLSPHESFLINKRLEDFWDSYEEMIRFFEMLYPEDLVFSRRYFMFPTELACKSARTKEECMVALNHYRRFCLHASIKSEKWDENSVQQEIDFWQEVNTSLRRFDPPPREQARVVTEEEFLGMPIINRKKQR